ncbi:hypothetical protein RUND412_000155 [Rhizina undulata]
MEQSEGTYLNQPIELFARSHRETKFNGDLTIFIEAFKRNSAFNGEDNTTASCSATLSSPSAIFNNDSVGEDGKILYTQYKPAMLKREVMDTDQNKVQQQRDVFDQGFLIVEKNDIEDFEDWEFIQIKDVEK